jgi:hypothetical protein
VRFRHAGAVSCDHWWSASDHRSGISESSEILVRTSSLRLLSWVEVASMLFGQRSLR